MSDTTGISQFFSGLAEALKDGLTVVEQIIDNLPTTEDKALSIWTASGSEYLIVFKDGKHFLARRPAGEKKWSWSHLDPKEIEPLPGGSVDFGTWKCTQVQRINSINRDGTINGWFFGRFPSE